MPIPETLLIGLQLIPGDRPVALLMRHSARFPITDAVRNYDVGLTPEGFEMADQLGKKIGAQFKPGRLASSPVGRCIDTANTIARGAGWTTRTQPHPCLSHEHIEPAWDLVAAGRVNGHPPSQVIETMRFLSEHDPTGPCLELFVTHDTVLGAVVGSLLHCPVQGDFWPGFLEGVFVWQDKETTQALWRGEIYIIHSR